MNAGRHRRREGALRGGALVTPRQVLLAILVGLSLTPTARPASLLVAPEHLAGLATTQAQLDAGFCVLSANATSNLPLAELTISQARQAFVDGALTCRELVEGYMARILALDRTLGLFSVRAAHPDALAEADKLDATLRETRSKHGALAIASATSGDEASPESEPAAAARASLSAALPPLFCVPVLVKDNIDVRGQTTTAGSEAMRGNEACRDAPVVARLRARGALVLGKASMGEWALFPRGAPNSLLPPSRNPYDLRMSVGGSSSGSAAAVSAGLAQAALGTDTGSSVRGPAALAGVVGFRPSLGAVSNAGSVPLRRDKDAVGPIARTVADAALLFEAMREVRGAESAGRKSRGSEAGTYLRGRRVGVLSQIVSLRDTSPEVRGLFARALADLQKAGAQVVQNVTISHNCLGLDWNPSAQVDALKRPMSALGHWNVRGVWVDLWGCLADVQAGLDDYFRGLQRGCEGETPEGEDGGEWASDVGEAGAFPSPSSTFPSSTFPSSASPSSTFPSSASPSSASPPSTFPSSASPSSASPSSTFPSSASPSSAPPSPSSAPPHSRFQPLSSTPRPPGSLQALIASKLYHPLSKSILLSASAAAAEGIGISQAMGCQCGPLESDPCRSAFRQALLDTMNALNLTVLVHPTWGAFAPGLEEDPADSGAGNYSPMIAPLTGAPAVSVPMGFGSQGLPAGLTFLGRPGDDDAVLEAALAYETFSQRREAPPLFGECPVH